MRTGYLKVVSVVLLSTLFIIEKDVYYTVVDKLYIGIKIFP